MTAPPTTTIRQIIEQMELSGQRYRVQRHNPALRPFWRRKLTAEGIDPDRADWVGWLVDQGRINEGVAS